MNVYRTVLSTVLSVCVLGASQARADEKDDLQKILAELGELRRAAEKDRQEGPKWTNETKSLAEAFRTLAAETIREAQARAEEAKSAQKALEECRQELLKSQEQANDLRIKLAGAEFELQAAKKNNHAAEKLVAEMGKQGPQRVGIGDEQPVEPRVETREKEIRGKVAGLADAGLYVVSIGTDDGVKPGQTMEVFKAEEKPRHIGAVTIVRVYSNQAVGQFKADGKERAELGDDVTARVAVK